MENLQVLEMEKEAKVLDSREVAEMGGITHSDLLKKLEGTTKSDGSVKQIGIIKCLDKGNFPLGEYFIESSYVDKNNQSRKCYLFTKLGCEFIANKFTGEKGILFTAKYVKRFNDMEKSIKQNNLLENYLNMSEEERGIIYFKTLKERKELALQNGIKNKLLLESKEKTDVYDNFINSTDLYSVNDVSKILAIKHLGRNNFYKYLRDNKIIMKDMYVDYKGVERAGAKNFEAYARYVNVQEYFIHRSRKINCGRKTINQNVAMFTPKGVDWIIKKLKKDEYIVTKNIEDIIEELRKVA